MSAATDLSIGDHARAAGMRVIVSMKSIARIASAWERRKSAHVTVVRCGAGSTPSVFQNLPHGRGSDPDTEEGGFALDASVGSPRKGSRLPGAGQGG